MRATWKPYEKHGELTSRADLPDSVFAIPKKRKEPLTDAKARAQRYRTFRSDDRCYG